MSVELRDIRERLAAESRRFARLAKVADQAGGALRTHLKGDTTGLALLAAYDRARDEKEGSLVRQLDESTRAIANLEGQVAILEDDVANLIRQGVVKDERIAQKESTISDLRAAHRDAMSEARKWKRKASPPLALNLALSLPECGAAGGAAFGLSEDPWVGVGAGLACEAVNALF